MPVFVKFESDLVMVVVDGDFTAAEFRRKGHAALDGPDVPHPTPVLVDFSGAAGMARRTPEDLRETVDVFAHRAREVERVALVASRDLEYGFMRMGAVFAASAGFEVSVFRNRAEARTWLAGRERPPA